MTNDPLVFQLSAAKGKPQSYHKDKKKKSLSFL